MRIDTNILFSALLFSNVKPVKVLLPIADNHKIALCAHRYQGLAMEAAPKVFRSEVKE